MKRQGLQKGKDCEKTRAAKKARAIGLYRVLLGALGRSGEFLGNAGNAQECSGAVIPAT